MSNIHSAIRSSPNPPRPPAWLTPGQRRICDTCGSNSRVPQRDSSQLIRRVRFQTSSRRQGKELAVHAAAPSVGPGPPGVLVDRQVAEIARELGPRRRMHTAQRVHCPPQKPVARCPLPALAALAPWDAAPHIFSQRRTVMPCEPSPAGHSPPEVTLRGQAETRCSFSPSKTPRQANRPLQHPWLPMCVLLQTALTIQLTALHRHSHH